MKELEIKCTKGIIPFPGYIMNFFGKILIRESDGCGKSGNPRDEIKDWIMNHEGIHWSQVEDIIPNPDNKNWKRILGYTIFYILYGIEWFIKGIMSIFTFGYVRAYMSISWEQEAYYNDYDMTYQDTRERWASLPYILKLVIKKKRK